MQTLEHRGHPLQMNKQALKMSFKQKHFQFLGSNDCNYHIVSCSQKHLNTFNIQNQSRFLLSSYLHVGLNIKLFNQK